MEDQGGNHSEFKPFSSNSHELPGDRIKAVETGLAMYQQSQAEVDRLRNELRVANETISQMQVQLESMRQLSNMLESQIHTHQMERDVAVADRAVYETLFASLQGMLRAFNIPAAPVITTKTQPRLPAKLPASELIRSVEE
jgi:septal ring factor EnvC (AmiA/AmiB activator)